ncbi:MAG: methyltransferase [Candidatus Lokiarchaeota archaeon]|jgi:HemK-related putative methylase
MIAPPNDPIINCNDDKIYFPSDDTFLIIDYFKKAITKSSFDGYEIKEIHNILDMGTGTGIIVIFLKMIANQLSNFNPRFYASDILKEAILCAKNNKKINNVKGKIYFIQSDLFKYFPIKLKNKFNVIIFNPPYLPALDHNKQHTVSDIDYSWNGGDKGYETLINFFNEVPHYLNLDNGAVCLLYFVTSSRINKEKFPKVLAQLGFQLTEVAKTHLFFEDIILNRAVRIPS